MKNNFLFMILAAISLVACSSEPPMAPDPPPEPEPITTGIIGQVVVGPMMPVCLENDPACFPPVEATFQLYREGVEVLTFQTGSDGKFQIELPAGDYQLVGGDDAPQWVSGKTLNITVPDGPMITIRLEFITPIV